MQKITRKEAMEQKFTNYFTGKPCKRGHVAERSVLGSNCVECRRLALQHRYVLKGEEILKQCRQWNYDNPEKRLLITAKARAKKKDIKFDLDLQDIVIPQKCPVLDIPIILNKKQRMGPNSPSLDRIIPSRGYVKGNVIVVSNRANLLKKDASIDELVKLARFYKRYNDR